MTNPLHRAIHEAGITQAMLASSTGLSEPYVSQLVHGHYCAGRSAAKKLIGFFKSRKVKLSYDELFAEQQQ
jgi:predicted transcriptional regulator